MSVRDVDLIMRGVTIPRHRRWFLEHRALEVDAPWPGDRAPDFVLERRVTGDGPGERVGLSDFRGRMVLVVFGSWTCPPFRREAEHIAALHDEIDDLEIVLIYTAEPHPVDGDYPVPENGRDGVAIPTAVTRADRMAAAGTCALAFPAAVTMLVDDMDDSVARTYAGRPDRLYLIDREGTIHWRSAPGPHGFDLDAAERAIETLRAAGGITPMTPTDRWQRAARAVDRLRYQVPPPRRIPPWRRYTVRYHRRRVLRRWKRRGTPRTP